MTTHHGGRRSFQRALFTSPYSVEAANYFAAMAVQPPNAWKVVVDLFIRGCKSDGLWDKFDGGHFLAAPTQQAALVDFKAPSRIATLVLTPTFTANRGFTGTGTAGEYIDTGFTPSVSGVAYQQDSASLGVYANNNITSAVVGAGVSTGSSAYMVLRSNSNQQQYRMNDATTVTVAGATDGSGLTVITRTGATATQGYQRGAAFGAAASNASTLRPTGTIKYLSAGGTSVLHELSFGFFGGGLTGSEVAALTARVNTALAAILVM